MNELLNLINRDYLVNSSFYLGNPGKSIRVAMSPNLEVFSDTEAYLLDWYILIPERFTR